MFPEVAEWQYFELGQRLLIALRDYIRLCKSLPSAASVRILHVVLGVWMQVHAVDRQGQLLVRLAMMYAMGIASSIPAGARRTALTIDRRH